VLPLPAVRVLLLVLLVVTFTLTAERPVTTSTLRVVTVRRMRTAPFGSRSTTSLAAEAPVEP
jgi:hypothetical protein